MSKHKAINILIAEDDEEDRMLAGDALTESLLINRVDFVENGEDLMDYLNNKGKFSDKAKFPLPGLILLDLNMPKKRWSRSLKRDQIRQTAEEDTCGSSYHLKSGRRYHSDL